MCCSHRHVFLGLCCVSDSEYSAVEVEAYCGNPSHFFFGRPSVCESTARAALFAEDLQFTLCGCEYLGFYPVNGWCAFQAEKREALR